MTTRGTRPALAKCRLGVGKAADYRPSPHRVCLLAHSRHDAELRGASPYDQHRTCGNRRWPEAARQCHRWRGSISASRRFSARRARDQRQAPLSARSHALSTSRASLRAPSVSRGEARLHQARRHPSCAITPHGARPPHPVLHPGDTTGRAQVRAATSTARTISPDGPARPQRTGRSTPRIRLGLADTGESGQYFQLAV